MSNFKTFGRYELRGTLGAGASAIVYDSWDTTENRRVALKILNQHPSDPEPAETLARFQREADTAKQLHHPGIVQIYDSGEVDGVAYIAMELVEGRSLQDVMDEHARIAPTEIVRIMCELLIALDYSHQKRIVHRDIKPSNILLDHRRAVKIVDFGIARIESSKLTRMGTMIGTPAYMSPQQIMNEPIDHRADIWSAGVILYQLLTGEKPFDGTLTTVIQKVLRTTPPAPSELTPTLPFVFDEIVAKAISRNPDDRYSSAAGFASALQDTLKKPAPSSPVPSSPALSHPTVILRRSPAEQPEIRSLMPNGRLLPLLCAAGVVVLGAATGAYFALSPSRPSHAPADAVSPLANTGQDGANPVSLPVIPSPVQLPSTAEPDQSPSQLGSLAAPATGPTDLPDPPSIVPAPQNLATSQPENLLPGPMAAPMPARSTAAAILLSGVSCTLLAVAPGEGNSLLITGVVGAGAPEAAARAAIVAAGYSKITWSISRFDGPYCDVINVLRSMQSNDADLGSGFTLRLNSGDAVLHGKARQRRPDIIVPRISSPAFSAYLLLVYFNSKQGASHLLPTKAAPARIIAPGTFVAVGDPKTEGWGVDAPFGTDLMVAVMSSAPIPMAVPDNEKDFGPGSTDAYLLALQRAGAEARRNGAKILARVVVVHTSP